MCVRDCAVINYCFILLHIFLQSMLVNAAQKKYVDTSTVMKKSLEKVHDLKFAVDLTFGTKVLNYKT